MLPTCLIVNFTESQPVWLLELIVGQKEVTEGDKKCLVWPIATKYYTAKVLVKVVDYGEFLVSKDSSENIEAVVFVCGDSIDTLKIVDKVWGKLEESSPSVCLLVSGDCEQLQQTEQVKSLNQEFVSWCLENEFELVDLSGEVGNDESSEDDFDDKFGKERIVEALLAHTWTNLVLVKEGSEKQKKGDEEEVSDDEFGEFVACPEADLDTDSGFDALFSKLSTMKEKASDLPDSDRKVYAENVAIAFFKAMGGTEEDF